MHDKDAHEGGGDFTAVTVARKALLDLSTVGAATVEETIQFHVVLLCVHDYSVRLVVALKELREISAVAYECGNLGDLTLELNLN